MKPVKNINSKVLIFGAGTIGSYYAYKLNAANIDVTLLARGERYSYLQENGLQLIDELTDKKFSSKIRVIDQINPDEVFDYVIVLVRKNSLQPIIKQLSTLKNLKNIIFMGNNVLGFDEYTKSIEKDRLFFGFPNVGGRVKDQIVYFTEKAENEKAESIIIGEIDGSNTPRLNTFKVILEKASFIVEISKDIDAWLKYHAAFVIPICCALYKHNCDNYAVAKSKETTLEMVKAAKDSGNTLKALGYKKRYPFKYNLFYWLPEKMTAKVMTKLFDNEYARISFAQHASIALDEFEELYKDFFNLIVQAHIKTPNFDKLSSYISYYKNELKK